MPLRHRTRNLCAPPAIGRAWIRALSDPKRSAYGQVATLDGLGHPQVRTVHLRWLPEKDAFGFICHIDSPKWKQLARSKSLAGLYYDPHRLVQWRWSGRAERVAGGNPEDRALLDRLWGLLRAAVRAEYWRDHLGSRAVCDLSRRAPNAVLVLCRPRCWDVFDMHPTDYAKGKRTLYARRARSWSSRRVSMLHGRPLQA